ncbi:MAG: DNA-deoxyinosine glycosylase [Pseudomonadota bacterium]|nr:DNA-deoxyinosine glycosylase [Pseudomonadota bacterium]
MIHCLGFKPIVSSNPQLLVLGTMPSVESLNQAFYYAHPRNAFWPIMQSLVNMPINTIDDKIALVDKAGLAVWDVLESCDRQGSLDSAIKSPQANDFESFLVHYEKINTICFNGKKAEQLFKRYVLKEQKIPNHIRYIVLPSTSPANASITVEDKRLFWQEKLSNLV